MLQNKNSFPAFVPIAWLIIRISFGILYIMHGAPKVFGGPESWAGLGSTLEMLGISFGHTFFGLMAGLAEFLGGILLLIGLFTRPAAAMLLITMMVATLSHIMEGDGYSDIAHPIKGGMVFIGFLLAGPGPMSLDERFFGPEKNAHHRSLR